MNSKHLYGISSVDELLEKYTEQNTETANYNIIIRQLRKIAVFP